MRYLFTLYFLLLLLSAQSQTPLAQIFHGCSGATVTAYPGDPLWQNVTYNFQRFEGGNWVTVHTNTNNWHLITPGDITVSANYRAVVHNNITNEDRTSNGVTANPALFFNTVLPPNPEVTLYWGGDNTGGANFAEILPHPFGADSRPPYTFEYKRTTDVAWISRVATTGIFVSPLDANTEYQFRVTDVCGQVSNIGIARLSSQASAVQTITNCTNGALQVGVTASGSNFTQRAPFGFAVAMLPPGTPVNPVPDVILNSLSYQYSQGVVPSLPNGLYVVRAKDRFNVLSDYVVRAVNSPVVAPPQYVSSTVGSSYCFYNINISSSPFEKGIRVVGSNQPYTFSTGPVFADVPVGNFYEMVLKDTCGNLSNPTPISISALPPRINSTPVTVSNCKYVITVNADVCGTPEYGIKLSGSSTITWQTSKVFSNLPMSGACDSIYVRDLISGLITGREVCRPLLFANTIVARDAQECSSSYYVQLSPASGLPPYSYSISYDGINFTVPTSTNLFSGLKPGTYTFKVTDGCGLATQTSVSTIEAGSVFYLKESGVNTNCTNGDTLGGYLKFGLRLFNDDNILSPAPYSFIVKEVVSVNGNEVTYGNTVYSRQSNDTIISIKGLEGNKEYGFFVTNSCGQIFTSANRVLNAFAIPSVSAPEPLITIDATNCASPFIAITNFPLNTTAMLYAGEGTTGTIQTLIDDSTSDILAGGFYTVRFTSANINGCFWEKTQTIFVNTTDSTRAGEFDPGISSGFCSGISSTINLHQNIKNETPGGDWSADPALIWSNQAAGEFVPADQAPGIYRITFLVTSDCGVTKFLEFQISINADYCRLTLPGDYESARTSSGCKTYSGSQWQHVFSSNGELVYSINAGNGNSIQSTCWGVRSLITIGNPRSTTINGNTVYFAPRNFYIEPSASTIANPPVRIRLYYKYDELNLLLNYLRVNGFPAATVNDLRILKKQAGPGSPVNLDIVNDPGTPSSLYNVITPVAVPYGPFGAYYFEFEINSFSELAIVFSNNFSLPLTWTYFTGQVLGTGNLLKWGTGSETNTASFDIEHSLDGISYSKVGSLPAAGISTTGNQYQFIHTVPMAGKNYYRIKQIDLDRKFTYSSIIVLRNEVFKRITVNPNPVQQRFTVYFNGLDYQSLQLVNSNGQIVYRQSVPAGSRSQTIDISHLSAGVYVLQARTVNIVQNIKLVKQ